MAGWQTVATDNFDRANGAIGSNWGTPIANINGGGLVISSNIAIAGGGLWTFSGSYYIGASPSNNQRITATTTAASGSDVWIGMYIRYTKGGGDTGYHAQINLSGSSNIIYKIINGVSTLVISAGAKSSIAIGTPVRFTAEGSTLTVETYSGGSWSTRFSGTDTTITAGTGAILAQKFGNNGWNDFILEDILGIQHYTLAMDPGSFSMAGTPILLPRSAISLGLSPGAFSMAGSPLFIWKAHPPIVMDAGAFALTGADLSIKRPVSYMRMDPGAFVMNGTPMDPHYGWYRGVSTLNYQFPKQRRQF